MSVYSTPNQDKNLGWYLPRPKPDYYKGGMPLYCEKWLLELAKDILDNPDPKILNLFCGMNEYGVRVDIKPEVNPDYVGDAHKLTEFLPDRDFDIVLADPPYSNEEAKELYGTPPLNYRVWTGEANKVLKPGGLFVVYHKKIVPNPDPAWYDLVKRVFVATRVWHLPRVAMYFRKIDKKRIPFSELRRRDG